MQLHLDALLFYFHSSSQLQYNYLQDLADHKERTPLRGCAIYHCRHHLNISCAGRPHFLATLSTQSCTVCARESQLTSGLRISPQFVKSHPHSVYAAYIRVMTSKWS